MAWWAQTSVHVASIDRSRACRGPGENIMKKLQWIAFGAALAGLWSAAALAADSGPVKIALIADKTGPLEAYAKQTSAGFAIGLDYATGGTMMVDGHKLIVIEKDSQTKPDVGRNLLNEAYNDDGADIAVG